MSVSIVCLIAAHQLKAKKIAAQLNKTVLHEYDTVSNYSLVFSADGVSLHSNQRLHGPIRVDFSAGSNAHRRHYGGGKGQLIAKAVGISSGNKPSVLDMTAGLGGDAFVLASLGCRLTLIEQNTIVFALLEDGIQRSFERACDDIELSEILSRIELVHCNAQQWQLNNLDTAFDVVYLDPMFPARQKSAAVKKEMTAFHAILEPTQDEAELLGAARKVAVKRVVVKRPKLADNLAGTVPARSYKGKSSRFDIYLPC